MKRPTKDQAEALTAALIVIVAVGVSLYQDGVVETAIWLLSVLVTIVILFGLLGLARRIGR